MAPPQWAYEVENFVNKPDDELVCSVCHSIFSDPVICPCDHVFCRMCITKWLQNNSNCPICRKQVPMYSIRQMVPIIKNLIMKLILYCQNKELGCEAQFTLDKSETHMKECNYELVHCKNRPCKERILRKDIQDHEINVCPHRYMKCKKCGSKVSFLSSPKVHDCIRALQIRLRRKNNIIRKKNNKIKELRNEIKSYEVIYQDSAESLTSPSTVLSFSPDEIIVTDMSLVSQDSDESFENQIIAIFDDLPSDHSSDENGELESSIFVDNHYESPLDLNEYHNAEFQTLDDTSSNEIQNDSQSRNENLKKDSVVLTAPDSASSKREKRYQQQRPTNQKISIPVYTTTSDDDDDNEAEEHSSKREEKFQQERPIKQKISIPVYTTSDDDDNVAEELNSLTSPRVCWYQACSNANAIQPENNLEDSSNSYMEPGTSSKYTASNDSNTSTHSNTSTRLPILTHLPYTEYSFRPKTLEQRQLRNPFLAPNPKAKSFCSKSAPSGSATFEITLACLEEYNFESDSEWLPEFDVIDCSNATADCMQSSPVDPQRDNKCPPNCKVYVGDLDLSVTKHDIEAVFCIYGPLRDVWIARNPPGFAFVVFEDCIDARNAVSDACENGIFLWGQRLRVELATVRSQTSHKRPSRRPFHPGVQCYNCGRRGHYARDCKRT